MDKEINIINDCTGLTDVEIIQRIIESRKIENQDLFFMPSEDYIANPFELKNMKSAIDCTINHCTNGSKILIYADTDLDGCSSAAIIYRGLSSIFSEDNLYIYINEGKDHGINDAFFENTGDIYDLYIIVDSLNSTTEYYDRLNGDIIILDHHDIDSKIDYDKNTILVSSQREYHNKGLCGAGVCLQFIRALDEELGTIVAEDLYDLAAVGLIGDMMPVDESHLENRAIIYKGFSKPKNEAIKKLAGNFELNSTTVSFSIAPLINSAVRMHKNMDAVMSLVSSDIDEVADHIKVLNKTKRQQTKVVDNEMPVIYKQVEGQNDEPVVFVLLSEECPSDISGLIGNKLLPILQRPVFVLKEYPSFYAGSFRAIGVKDFRAICNNTKLGSFNGHPLAAGSMIPKENYEKFKEIIRFEIGKLKLKNQLNIDALIDCENISEDFIKLISTFDYITGNEFPRIKFGIKISDFILDDGVIDKNKKHTIVTLDNNINFKIIKWNDRSMFDDLDTASLLGNDVLFVGTIEMSPIYGRGPKMIVEEIIIGG